MQQYQRIELGFNLDDFKRPIAYSGVDAWVQQIVQLCAMDPGTIPSNPTIGVGMSRYEFLLEEDRLRLCNEINRQVPLFYPDMPFNQCIIETSTEEQYPDLIYMIITFTVNGSLQTAVVAAKKGYKYIDFAIAI